MSLRLRTKATVGVVGVTAALLLASIAPGSAEPTSGEPTTSALPAGVTSANLSADAAVNAFVQPILRAHGTELQVAAQWGSARLLIAAKAPIAPEVAKTAGQTIGGLTVVVSPAAYSPADYDAAIRAIGASTAFDQSVIAGFNLPADAGHIDVYVQGLNSMSVATAGSLRKNLETLTGGDSITLVPSPVLGNFSRQDDSSPWFGGGMMLNPLPPAGHDGDRYCTTGFAVLDGIYGRLLGARHCNADAGQPATWAWHDGTGVDDLTYGTNNKQSHVALDSLLMDPVGGTGGQVHGGAWNATQASDPRYHLNVKDAQPSFLGQRLCSSGANTGEHCGLEVIAHADVNCTDMPSGVCHKWIAYNSATEPASGPGDSGGPVYNTTAANPDNVIARGIIQGGAVSDSPTCGSARWYDGLCATGVLFVGISDILSYWGVQIETN